MKTLAQFVKENKIGAQVRSVPVPKRKQDGSTTQAWRVRLHRPDGEEWRRFEVTFCGGSAVSTPDAADVLNCVSSDSSIWEGCANERSLADELGMSLDESTDRTKARKLYDEIEIQRNKLVAFLATDDGRDLYDELLYQVEGL